MSIGLFLFAFTASVSQLAAFLTCQGPCIEVAGYPGAGKGSCMFITEERANWSGYNDLCMRYVARPVQIPDSRTNDVVNTAVRLLSPVKRPWIGGYVRRHRWAWVNGSPFYNETGCCSGLLNADLHRLSPTPTPYMCVTSCRNQQYQYAYIKGDNCGCSNNTCVGPESVTCPSVCNGTWRTSCPVDLDNSIRGYSTNGHVLLAELRERGNACGVLRVQGGRLSIVTQSCNEQLRFLCENVVTLQLKKFRYDANNILHGSSEDCNSLPYFNNSFSASTQLLSFLDSRMSCLDRESDLLVIPNSRSNLTQLDDGSYWIGLTRFSITWYPDQPALFYATQDFDNHYIGGCFFVDPMSLRGQWFVDSCSTHRHALCIQDPELHAIPDQASLPNNDSVFFIPDEDSINWCQGEEVCQRHGGRLVVIPDQHVDSLVSKFLENISETVWIGGKISPRTWTTVTGQRLYNYSGCCPFLQTDEGKTFPGKTYCAGICVPLCKQHGYQYAYLQYDQCACSNTTCSENYSGVCSDKCLGDDKHPETCGNYKEGFYTVYHTTELDLPPWNPQDLQSLHYCAVLEITGSTVHLTPWGCDTSFQYMCSVNGTDSDNITTHEKHVSWLMARKRCLENGGDLATVGRYSPLLTNLRAGKYWVGISQFILTWHTGDPMRYNGLDSFADSYVNGCVKLRREPPHWISTNCFHKSKPLCFMAPPQTTISSSPGDKSSATTQTTKPSPQETSANTGTTYSTSSPYFSSVPNTTTPDLGLSETVKVLIGCTVTVSVVLVVVVSFVLKKRMSEAASRHENHFSSPMLNLETRPL